jgi:hypothetical protein
MSRNMKKWLLIASIVGALVIFVSLPTLQAGSQSTDVNQLTQDTLQKREMNRMRIEKMRMELRDEGCEFEIDYNAAMNYRLEDLCGTHPEFQTRLAESICYNSGVNYTAATLPASYTGIYTPIKDQGQCGSCWAFSTVAGLEAAIKKTSGSTLNLSEQYLVSCNSLGYGCNGGWFAFGMATNPGIILESCFPYVANDVTCKYCTSPVFYKAKNYGTLSSGVATTTAIKNAIMTYGSVSAAMYCDSYFQAYKSGVFTHNANKSPNHAIILCGWDDTKGAWYLKNSWGTSWGISGFMWIKYGVCKVGYGASWCSY